MNLSFKDALLDDKLESISRFITQKFGINSDLEKQIFSQNLTLAVVSDRKREQMKILNKEHKRCSKVRK